MARHAGWMVRAPLVLAGALLGALFPRAGAPGADMSAAAARYLDSLTPELRARANPPFDDAARLDWHYVPRSRPGVTLGEMSEPQRIAARDLVRSALSSRGVLKAETIMSLDAVLRDVEQGRGPVRDPLKYTVEVYGKPGDAAPWGWKIEGHHVSLNFTVVDGAVAATPSFLGANPAEIRHGERAGLRVLAAEEDLGRTLVRSLSAEQRQEAVVSRDAPRDILSVPGRGLDGLPATGLSVEKMGTEQRALVERLLEEFAGTLRHELATGELDRIRAAGVEKIVFAWAGGDQPGQGHYYRLSGPTFLIEYDNTQDGANHVHTVWHDRQRDFGRDVLKEHYESGHAAK